jgi:hypothetical protein
MPDYAMELAMSLSHESNLDDSTRSMVEAIIEPFVEYLEQNLATDSDVLYLLEKYKRRVEWFDREDLYAAYHADPARGEKVYDSDLRRFLLDQGVDFPFSQPRSASGEADSVAGIETDDPLVCEVKLFGTSSYGVPYLAKGLNQALQYAQDYSKSVAHLVIINLGEQPLELPSDAADTEWPPRIQVAGVTVYLVAIRALPMASASKAKRLKPTVVKREQLAGTTA